MEIAKNPIIVRDWFGSVMYVDETDLGEECVVYNLSVDKNKRLQGVGSSLVKLALKSIFQQGYKKAFVVVENLELIPFYEKLGFEIVESQNQVKNKVEMYYYKKPEEEVENGL